MRIMQLIPGAGDTFYCGNCLRDQGLASILIKQGHDVVKIPLYLPMLTDNNVDSTGAPIFFGGINVFLQQKIALFRKTPRSFDRLFDAHFLLKWAAGRVGMTRASDLADTTLSMLQGEDGFQAKEFHRLIQWFSEVEIPDVIHVSNALLLGLAQSIKKKLNVPVVCSLQDEDGFIDSLPEPRQTMIWDKLSQLAKNVDVFIGVSNYYGKKMRQCLNIPASKICTVYNGIQLDGFSMQDFSPDPPVIGFLERQYPEKGVHLLVEAFIEIKKRDRIPGVKLCLAGGKTADDRNYVRKLRKQLAKNGLDSDVEFLPRLDRQQKQAFLKTLSIFSVPAVHQEAFGAYIIEAMAAGIPVVQPGHGAFPEIIKSTGGGVICEPNSSDALASAIENLLLNPDKMKKLGKQGREAVLKKFSVERMTKEFIDVLEKVVKPV